MTYKFIGHSHSLGFIAIVCASLVLSGCQTSRSSNPQTTRQTVVPAPPPRILTQGLGYSFEITEQELKTKGFSDLTSTSPDKVGTFVNWTAGDFFGIQKITLTPKSKRVFLIEGSKYYRGKVDDFSGCRADWRLMIQGIENKYPQLVSVSLGYGNAEVLTTRYCEGKGSYSFVPGPRPLGRCVEFVCANQNGGGSGLFVKYMDHDVSDVYSKEHKEHMSSATNDYLQQRGIDPKKF